MVSRTGFGYVGAGAFQARPAAFADEVEVELHAFHRRCVVRIVVDASEALAQRKSCGHGCGLAVFGWHEHVLQGDFGKSLHVDAAVQAVSDLLAIFVHAVQGVEHRGHDGYGAQARIVEHLEMEFLGPGIAMNPQRDRNQLGLFVEDAKNAGMAILHENARGFGHVDDLEGIER